MTGLRASTLLDFRDEAWQRFHLLVRRQGNLYRIGKHDEAKSLENELCRAEDRYCFLDNKLRERIEQVEAKASRYDAQERAGRKASPKCSCGAYMELTPGGDWHCPNYWIDHTNRNKREPKV